MALCGRHLRLGKKEGQDEGKGKETLKSVEHTDSPWGRRSDTLRPAPELKFGSNSRAHCLTSLLAGKCCKGGAALGRAAFVFAVLPVSKRQGPARGTVRVIRNHIQGALHRGNSRDY